MIHPFWRGTVHSALLIILAWSALGSSARAAVTTLIPAGSDWKYLDNGSNQGTSWRNSGFNDSSWASGAAQLGYGDDDEQTVVSYGPNSSSKYITTYFRRTFSVPDANAITALTLRLLRDDGAVVYINGTEVHRSNMPGGTVSYTTLASSALGSPAEATFVQAAVSRSAVVTGPNVIAVEIHQANGTSTDVSFDLELTASDQASVVRGPYLQIGTPTSVVVRWRTDAPTDSVIRYGLEAANLTLTASDSGLTTEHQVTLSGLIADTGYYYSVGTSAATLAAGADYKFYTSPQPDSLQPIRIWVLGDSGTANANAAAVRNAYYAFAQTAYTDLLLMLGDNAYTSGTDADYQAAVFNMYPEILRQTVLWPTIGNHDTAQSINPPADLPYFQMFTLPTNGEAGGQPSGTEKYYSFDYGNIHFVCLDSMTSSRAAGSPMLLWLQQDLAAQTKDWIIAFWHHPPYSKGSHDSDNDLPLAEMRQNALPILEAYGVDLVLSGHSHSYERSFLLDGHYGTSSTLTSANKIDGGSGRDAAAYHKPLDGPVANQGAVYVVAGSSGQISGGALNHPAMYISLNELGSMVLDVSGARLDAKFLNQNGTTRDYFSIVKDGSANPPPAVSITAPAPGASYVSPAQITITAAASDLDGIAEVAFYANGLLLGTDTTGSPYSFDWIDVPAGNYNLTAVARDTLGAESTSTDVPVTVTNPPSPIPSAPSNLAATSPAKDRVNLSWVDNSTNEDGFQIERAIGPKGAFGLVATVAPGATVYSETGLTANTSYRYRVRAFRTPDFFSDWSNTANVKTKPK